MTPSSRPHRPIEILVPRDIHALSARCSRRASTGVRHRALIAVLYGSGLRISEALAIHPRDIDLDGLAITVHAGKGARRRVAALLPDAVDAIQRWLDRRAQLGLSGQHVLFCTVGRGAAGPHPTAPGGALTREYVARVLRRLAVRAGIQKRVHPHGFRHSHADLLRRRGFDVEEIRKQLGHRSLLVTGLYLDHLGSHDLTDRIRSIGPVLEPKTPRQELTDMVTRLSESDITQLIAILRRGAR